MCKKLSSSHARRLALEAASYKLRKVPLDDSVACPELNSAPRTRDGHGSKAKGTSNLSLPPKRGSGHVEPNLLFRTQQLFRWRGFCSVRNIKTGRSLPVSITVDNSRKCAGVSAEGSISLATGPCARRAERHAFSPVMTSKRKALVYGMPSAANRAGYIPSG
jgi:hypothetical protein